MTQPLKAEPSEPTDRVDSAARIAAGLAERGFPIFADMDFTVGGSFSHSNAFLQFALSDDLACAEFMRVKTCEDVKKLPLALPAISGMPDDQAAELEALLCAQKVQMILYIAAEEIRQTLKKGTFSSREALRTEEDGLGVRSGKSYITSQDHYVSSLPLQLPLEMPQAAPQMSPYQNSEASQAKTSIPKKVSP